MRRKNTRTEPPARNREARQFLTIVRRALSEDIGRGDITTDAVVPPEERALGIIVAKEEGVLCGVDIARMVFEQVDPAVDFQKQLNDGSTLGSGTTIAIAIGKAAACLKAERTALNILQRLSGIATLTRKFVDGAAGQTKILDTRKTSAGLRVMEKYAVRTGGGHNHRFGLYDMIMIKDNHIQICGSITEAVNRVRQRTKKRFIEVEVRTMAELQEAIALGIDRIMLDNMNASQIARAVELVRGAKTRIEIEISGGVDIGDIGEIASYGADFVSVGALTHSARALDIAMKMKPLGSRAI